MSQPGGAATSVQGPPLVSATSSNVLLGVMARLKDYGGSIFKAVSSRLCGRVLGAVCATAVLQHRNCHVDSTVRT